MIPMHRRHFLKTAAASTMALEQPAPGTTGTPTGPSKREATWRGVNLGGWLVLEKWITPSVYAGARAEDEYSLCQELGKARAQERLKRHRETWITAEDFKWLAAHGLGAVRIPVGYAVAEENPPFVSAMDTLD